MMIIMKVSILAIVFWVFVLSILVNSTMIIKGNQTDEQIAKRIRELEDFSRGITQMSTPARSTKGDMSGKRKFVNTSDSVLNYYEPWKPPKTTTRAVISTEKKDMPDEDKVLKAFLNDYESWSSSPKTTTKAVISTTSNISDERYKDTLDTTTTNKMSTEFNMSDENYVDYAEPVATPIDVEMITTGLVYGITFIVGVIGNSLIIYSVFNFRRMKSLSNIFLANLATADLILLLVCVPVKFIQLFTYTWIFGEFACKSLHYIQNVSAICSVFTLTAISMERYYAIIHPVRSRYICTMSKTRRIIFISWISSIIMAAPVVWMQIHKEVGSAEVQAYWCVRNWDNPLLWQLYEVYMLVIILIFPLVIMSYCYGHICHRLWIVMANRTTIESSSNCHHNVPTTITVVTVDETTKSILSSSTTTTLDSIEMPSNGKSLSSSSFRIRSTDNNSSYVMRQVIKMLIAVVIIFIICWSPILIINVLSAFRVIDRLNYGNLKVIRISANLFSYINSCLNPIIYGFMSQNFRASFKAALAKCLGCQNINSIT